MRSLSSDTGSEDAAVWIAEDTTAQSHLVSEIGQFLTRDKGEEAEIVTREAPSRFGQKWSNMDMFGDYVQSGNIIPPSDPRAG